ncbi:hypothetical protein LINGRAHAP2_LOCUS24126, partial [Linum grandiflorum]
KISLLEVETLLLLHPNLTQAICFGVKYREQETVAMKKSGTKFIPLLTLKNPSKSLAHFRSISSPASKK